MSYTTPPTFVSGDALTAAQLNILGDDIVYLKSISDGTTFSGVKLRRSTNQSIADSTDTDVTWLTEVEDFGGWWSSGATITVPAGAIPSGYTRIAIHFDVRLKYASSSTGNRRATILVNGSSVAQRTYGGLGGGDSTDVPVGIWTPVASGDTIKVQAYQTSGGSLNLTEANIDIYRIAPLD